MTEQEIQMLARSIAVFLCPDALIDAKDVGALLGCGHRHVLQWYVKAPGFPKPVRLAGPEGKEGQPRWVRKDISSWVASQVKVEAEPKKRGRPRVTPAW